MPIRPEGLNVVFWALAIEAVVLVLSPTGRLGKILLALTTATIVIGMATWGVIMIVDW
jgi:hypothetical protein